MGRVAHPPETVARAIELRALGRSINSIGRELEVGPNTVKRWIDPAFKARQNKMALDYKAKRTGICRECGGPTTLLRDGSDTATLCKWCAQGHTPPPAPDKRRCVPIRLCDLSDDVLLNAAWEANRFEQGEVERQEILLAAAFPSDTVYFISRSARALLDEIAA